MLFCCVCPPAAHSVEVCCVQMATSLKMPETPHCRPPQGVALMATWLLCWITFSVGRWRNYLPGHKTSSSSTYGWSTTGQNNKTKTNKTKRNKNKTLTTCKSPSSIQTRPLPVSLATIVPSSLLEPGESTKAQQRLRK